MNDSNFAYKKQASLLLDWNSLLLITASQTQCNLFELTSTFNQVHCFPNLKESDEMFVLGVVFFPLKSFDFSTNKFWRNFLVSAAKILLSWAQIL